MTFYQFISLSKESRYIVWLAKARQIASYDNRGFVHLLYQLDSFYIEMTILRSLPEDCRMIAFADNSRLDPYLQAIDISEIFERC